jgi:uncharacterized protein
MILKRMLIFRIMAFCFAVASTLSGLKAQESILYKITGKDMQDTYIFAYIPSNNSNTYQVSDSVYMAMNQCTQIAVEPLVDSLDIERLKAQSVLPENIELKDLAGPKALDRMDDLLKAYTKMQTKRQKTAHPLYLYDKIMRGYHRSAFPMGFDQFFLNINKEENKKIISCYSVEQLQAIYRSVSPQNSMGMLMFMAHQFNTLPELYAQLENLYLNLRMEDLQNLLFTQLHTGFVEDVINEKINAIALNITENGKRGKVFYILPAWYFPGETGLLKLLKNKGLTVHPVGNGFNYRINSEDWPPLESIPVYRNKSIVRYLRINREYDDAYFEKTIPAWRQFTSYRGAFSMRMPDDPETIIEKTGDNGKPMQVNIYKFEDRALNLFYMVSYYDYPETFNLTYNTTLFPELISSTVNKFNGLLLLEKDISEAGYQGREIEISMDDDNIMRIRFYLIGRRLYQVALGSVGQKAYSKQSDAFLNSFRVLNERAGIWYRVNTGDFSIYMPMPPAQNKITIPFEGMHAEHIAYTLKEPNTDLHFVAAITYLPVGKKIKNRDDLFHRMVNSLADQLDGVLLREMNLKLDNKAKGLYVEIGSHSNMVGRAYFYYYKNRIAQLIVYGPDDSAFSGFAERFFDAFKYVGD